MKKYINNKLALNIFLILMLVVFFNSYSFAVEKYPIQPVSIIIPFSPGGTTDMQARVIQPYLKKTLDAPVITIENKPGANSIMGTIDFLQRKADGYTLFWEAGGIIFNKLLDENVNYEIEDFVPVIGVASDPFTFFVRKDSPYNDIGELIEDARKRPNEISLAYNDVRGLWTTTWLKKNLDMPVNLVGYPGGAPATAALIGGHVDFYMDAGLGRVPFRDKIRAIGVLSSGSKNWPEAMPLSELDIVKKRNISLPERQASANNMVWVRREVKENYPERYYRLVASFYEIAKDPEFNKKADDMGLSSTLVWWSPSEVEEVMASTIKMYEAEPELLKLLK